MQIFPSSRKVLPLALLSAMALAACTGDDRSGEQPFAPTVQMSSAVAAADSVTLTGIVVASPNSSLLGCGFYVGNDTLRITAACDSASTIFSAVVDSLEAGNYYAVAYARNGMGTSTSDTLQFQIAQ